MAQYFYTNLKKILTLILLFPIFFPYIKATNYFNNLDTQPYALIFSTLFLTYIFIYSYCKKVLIYFHYFFVILIFLSVYAFCISIIQDSFNLRNILGYLSITVFSITGYFYCKYNFLKQKFLYSVILIYLFFGIIQKFFDRRFGEFFLSNFRAGDGFRGANSLTPEPSFYSNQLIFIFILLSLINNNIKSKKMPQIEKIIYLLIIVQIFFLSQAITGVIYITVLLSLLCILYKKIIPLFFIPITILFSIFYSTINTKVSRLNSIFYSTINTKVSRLNSFFYELNNNPDLIITKDESVNQRLSDIVISCYGFITKLPFSIGHGTNSWNNFINENYINFKFIFFPALSSNKIMSGYGGILFETGIIGLIFLIIPYSFFILKLKRPNAIAIALFMPLFMLSAVQISNPLFGFILGYAMYIPYQNEKLLSHKIHSNLNA